MPGKPLAYAVARAEYGDDWTSEDAIVNVSEMDDRGYIFQPHIDWAQGEPIIDSEGIRLDPPRSVAFWSAEKNGYLTHGPTPLIAAMRCYVASEMGDEVDVPDELLQDESTNTPTPTNREKGG